MSSANSETREDCTSTRSQATRSAQHQVSVMDSARTSPRGPKLRSARVKWKRGLSPNLEHAVKRPTNMPRKNPILALHGLVRIFMARTVIWIVSLCLCENSRQERIKHEPAVCASLLGSAHPVGYDTHTMDRPNRARRDGAGKRDGKTTFLSTVPRVKEVWTTFSKRKYRM